MGQANFSGTWDLNKTKSTLNEDFSMAPIQLVITQTESSITVERHSNFQGENITSTDKFTFDGKECINPGWMDSKKKSVVVLNDDKTILKITSKISMDGGDDMTITETFQMDSAMMKVVTTSSSSFGDMNETCLYDKK